MLDSLANQYSVKWVAMKRRQLRKIQDGLLFERKRSDALPFTLSRNESLGSIREVKLSQAVFGRDLPNRHSTQVIGSSRTSQLSAAKLHYYMPIQAAREYIWIENVYFLPDVDLKAGLCAAARRGVDVRIVVPGQYIDLKAVRYAGRGDYRQMLEAGVKIYEFQPTMLHCKVMVVDNVWSSIGSINFSSRSMKANARATSPFTIKPSPARSKQ